MIRIENVTKVYGGKEIVSDVSFQINNGELVVLIGESGCGKTTLLKIINRLVEPTKGSVYIDGENTSTKNVIELRRNIGYVIQHTGLFPHMTVRQNIEIIPKLQGKGKNKAEIAAKSIELMNMVGLDPTEYLDRYPHQLSGGQQQRIGVARAFACDPDVILMDEPFSALDPITRVQLQDELSELQSVLKKTIVFVTHDMDEAVKIADRICILNGGKIVQYDKVEEIMKNPADDFVSAFMGKNRIWSSPEFIKAEDIMIKKPVCASPELSVLRCIEKMKAHNVDSLLITDKKSKLLGVAKARSLKPLADKSVAVRDVMKTDYMTISPQMNIIEILALFTEKKLSAISTVDENNILKGLITKTSLLTTLSQQYLESENYINE